jgi:F-type H+-transporting ATPase subunit b
MNDILSQLGQLFVQTIPTVIFVFLLFIILERIFFRPMTEVLRNREAATTGAIARAKEQASAAGEKSREYEASFQAARQEVYRQREADRKILLQERENTLQEARQQSEALTKEAQASLAGQVEAAKRELDISCTKLGGDIARAILGADEGSFSA